MQQSGRAAAAALLAIGLCAGQTKAAAYDFTSALPVQILKELQPALLPLIAGKEAAPAE
jgi:hypothetical protein